MKIGGVDILEGWNDLRSPFNTGKAVGPNVPTFADFIGGIKAYNFSASTMEELQMMPLHVEHDYKGNSIIFPHIHWSPDDTDTGVVRWGIEYSPAKGHGQQAFPATTTIFLEQAGSGTAKMHQLIQDVPGFSTNLEPDTLVLLRVFRDAAHVNDTYTGVAWGHFADMHYKSDRKNTLNNTPNFYG